jgi:hypothetical protein
MHNLLRCRRGSAAFATVAALVPLIGVVALGGEAGSWYVTKQHAQNAADSAATSGALTIAIQNAGRVSTISEPQTYDYRGKEFAARNAFCNAGDTSYPGSLCVTNLPTGTSQTVQIERGTYDVTSKSWTPDASGQSVRATVSQQQRAYLAAVLGLSTVNIGAQAIAQVKDDLKKDLCGLGLGRWPSSQSPLSLGGSVNLTGNGCALMSNGDVKYASTPTFNGSGWAVYGANGCVNSGNCDPGVPYNYNMPPAWNPLQALDTDGSLNSSTGNTKTCASQTCSLTPNSSGAYGNLTVTTGDTVNFAPGTYFFYNAAIKINGGTVSGTDVTLVLLGDSSLSISGGTVNLSAPAINTTSSNLNGVLIDDQAPNKSKNAVTVNGSGTVTLGGAMYFPNVDVTWSGTGANINTTCTLVIANSLNMSGNAYLNSQGCDALGGGGGPPTTQPVVLVK